MRLVVSLGLMVAIAGCSAPAAAPTLDPVNYSLTGRSYGVGGTITQTEFQFFSDRVPVFEDFSVASGLPRHDW